MLYTNSASLIKEDGNMMISENILDEARAMAKTMIHTGSTLEALHSWEGLGIGTDTASFTTLFCSMAVKGKTFFLGALKDSPERIKK